MARQVNFDRQSFDQSTLNKIVDGKISIAENIVTVEDKQYTLVNGTFYLPKDGSAGLYLYTLINTEYKMILVGNENTNLITKIHADGKELTNNGGTINITADDLGLASAYKYQGSVKTYALLEQKTTAEVGDVWNVEDTGMNYACRSITSKTILNAKFTGLKTTPSEVTLDEGGSVSLPLVGVSATTANYDCYLHTDGNIAFLYAYENDKFFIVLSTGGNGYYNVTVLDDYPTHYGASNSPMSNGSEVTNYLTTDHSNLSSTTKTTIDWDTLGSFVDLNNKQDKLKEGDGVTIDDNEVSLNVGDEFTFSDGKLKLKNSYALSSDVENNEKTTAAALTDLDNRVDAVESGKQDNLSSVQLDAVNSGITSEKVGKSDAVVSNYTTIHVGAGYNKGVIGISGSINYDKGTRILFKPAQDGVESADSIKISINGQQAEIWYNGANVGNRLKADAIYDMIYDGTQWNIVGGMGGGLYWQNE